MEIFDTKALCARGRELAAPHKSATRKLILIYCGVLAALSLGSNGLHLYLDSQISGTGGLAGLGTRSILETIQQVLSYINSFFGPFWSAGFLYAMLGMVRGREPEPRDLTEGFRRFGRILSSTLYEMMLIFSLFMVSGLLTVLIFSSTPWGVAVSQTLEPVLSDPNLFLPDGTVNMELLPAETLTMGVIPMMVLWGGLFLIAAVFVHFTFRMAPYLMMERRIGGIAALFLSRRLLRGWKRRLLKLDLRLWWYHALNALLTVVCYLDLIFALLGIQVPIDPTVLFFLTLGAYCVLLTALSLWKKSEVDAAYVLFFESVLYPENGETE